MKLAKIVEDTIVDGIGWRTSVYCTGCQHQCPGCHNKATWDINAGKDCTVDWLVRHLLSSENDITFSGGDPMYQAAEFAEVAKQVKQQSNKNIWCYTGFLFEQCLHGERYELLKNIDVLVDGPFIERLKSDKLLFRGSANQRLIDVQKSLQQGSVILLDINVEPEF